LTGDKPKPQSGDATESERALSSALMGGAFGFIGIAIFASASYADKVEPSWLWYGNLFATGAVILLVASIFFGGRGWTQKNKGGTAHPFNLQALSGLLGIILLGAAASVFAFNPKLEAPKADQQGLSDRIVALEAAQKSLSEALKQLPDHQALSDHITSLEDAQKSLRETLDRLQAGQPADAPDNSSGN